MSAVLARGSSGCAGAPRTALRRFLRSTDEAAAFAGLSGQRYNLLLMLKAAQLEGKPHTVSTLIARLELPQTAVSDLVRRAQNFV